MNYQILDHPAELRIKVFGQTKEELFQNACLAMAETLSSQKHKNTQNTRLDSRLDSIDPRRTAKRAKTQHELIKINSVDLNTLLIDFLNEILARSQINKKIYLVEEIKFYTKDAKDIPGLRYPKPGMTLMSKLTGRPIKRFQEDIKAVTYQDVNIQYKDNHYQTIIVFDI